MQSLKSVRGTRDIAPAEALKYRHVVDVAREVSLLYGFEEIATPIFEFSEVFKRTLGETSDIVSKEMYNFRDRGGEELTLRPEYTAGIARAFMSGGIPNALPLKLFASGPMFRYERPQKGRLRQFHQIDIEILGVSSFKADVELLALGAQILRELGITKQVRLEINSLGDVESRNRYRNELVSYFRDHSSFLSEDSLVRLERNPLRILDSKDESDKKIVANAPLMSQSLNDESTAFFDSVLGGLDDLKIDYHRNERLVRGLDYYNHTAFEFVTDALGAQGALIAGGRYDRLIETMGGPATAGIGWAGGVERLSMLANDPPVSERPIAVIPVSDKECAIATRVSHDLRQAGRVVEYAFRGNLSRRLKRANRLNARVAVVIGPDELKREMVMLRDLDSGSQTEATLDALIEKLTFYR